MYDSYLEGVFALEAARWFGRFRSGEVPEGASACSCVACWHTIVFRFLCYGSGSGFVVVDVFAAVFMMFFVAVVMSSLEAAWLE